MIIAAHFVARNAIPVLALSFGNLARSMTMRTLIIGAALAATTLATAALAEDTVIRERTETRPGVTVGVPGVSVGVGTQDRTTVTTETRRPVDCGSKTVHKEDSTGSTTVHKEGCD
jgi:outer membrane receptor protein involved in Fe transport